MAKEDIRLDDLPLDELERWVAKRLRPKQGVIHPQSVEGIPTTSNLSSVPVAGLPNGTEYYTPNSNGDWVRKRWNRRSETWETVGPDDGSVDTAQLVNGAVTTDKIANDAVTPDKLGNITRGSSWSARPSSPEDFAIYLFYFTGGAESIYWAFFYWASNWHFMGGPPAEDEVTAREATSSTTLANLSTNGPIITDLPAGRYTAEWGAYFERRGSGTVDTDHYMQLVENNGTSSITNGTEAYGRWDNPSGERFGTSPGQGRFTLSSQADVRCKYRTGNASYSAGFGERSLKVWPVYLND